MNLAPRFAFVTGSVTTLLLASGVWYAFSPAYTDVGYMPRQPIAFSHALHAGELEVDCRYCHASVEVSPVASLPPTTTCMNCHSLVARDSEALEPLRDSIDSGEPIRWVRVHNLPDYAFFDHSVHIGAAIDCTRCHGDIAAMEEVRQTETLSMRWCLDCHRHPPDSAVLEASTGPVDCTACHR
jgi:hypothetical protein